MIFFCFLLYLFNYTNSYIINNACLNLKSSHYLYTDIKGRVLFPGINGNDWWDTYKISNPVVLPPNKNNNKWLMFYYGRDGLLWNNNITALPDLPTGYIGLVQSNDGFNWNKVSGNYYKGAIMQPDNNQYSHDNLHIGVSDIIYDNKKYIMHYFGANEKKILNYTGLNMRCFVAKSNNAIDWYKFKNITIDIGIENEWDHLFTSFPRALQIEPNNLKSKWLITYHSFFFNKTNPIFKIGAIISNNKYGLSKNIKKGVILEPGKIGQWDSGGVSVRHIIHFNNYMYMFYASEGNHNNNYTKYAIGLAYSKDKGETWHKLRIKGKKDPGGPIFEARYNNINAWDNFGVSCPYIIKKPDGSLRMYYLGIGLNKNKTFTGAIGCSDCINNDLTKWKRVINKY